MTITDVFIDSGADEMPFRYRIRIIGSGIVLLALGLAVGVALGLAVGVAVVVTVGVGETENVGLIVPVGVTVALCAARTRLANSGMTSSR